MKKTIFIIILFYILLINPVYADKVVTILPFESIGIDNELKKAGKSISENLSIALNYSKNYYFTEYIKIDKVLKDTGINLSMLSNKSHALKLGKYLNSDIIIFGSLEFNEKVYTLKYSYLDKNSKIIKSNIISAKDIINLQKNFILDFSKNFKITTNNSSIKLAEITNDINALNTISDSRYFFSLHNYNKALEYLNKVEKTNNVNFVNSEKSLIIAYLTLMLKNTENSYLSSMNELEDIIKKAFKEKENILYAQKSSLIFNYLKNNKINENTINYLIKLYPLDSELFFIKFLDSKKEEDLKKAISLNPFNSIYYYYYSNYLYDKRLVDESVEMIEKALSLSKNNIFYLLSKSNIFFNTGRLDIALPIYKSILEIDKNNFVANYYLAKIYRYTDDLDSAKKYYKNLISIDSNNYLSYYELGTLYLEEGYTDKAIEEFSNAIKLKPNDAQIYYLMGRAYKLSDNKEEAINYYKKAIENNSNFFEAYYDMGIALKQLGKIREAEESFNKAIEINKDFAESYLNLGVIYYDKEEFQKAISYFQKAISLKPDYYRAYNNLGSIYLKTKNYSEAEKNFNLAIKYNQNYSLAYNNLGLLYQELGKKQEAKKYFDKSCSLGYLPACSN
jgi:tetratricopeptide (TPR) repeat protein